MSVLLTSRISRHVKQRNGNYVEPLYVLTDLVNTCSLQNLQKKLITWTWSCVRDMASAFFYYFIFYSQTINDLVTNRSTDRYFFFNLTNYRPNIKLRWIEKKENENSRLRPKTNNSRYLTNREYNMRRPIPTQCDENQSSPICFLKLRAPFQCTLY